MEKYVRVINTDKESETVKSVECFSASSIQRIWFDSMEDENHERFYYVRIVNALGTTYVVCATRKEDECYATFDRFYSWLRDDESNEFVFTIDRSEINDYFKEVYF